MNDLTSKDKAIAQALIAAGFELHTPDSEDLEFMEYWEGFEAGPCYEVEGWVVAVSIFDFYFQAQAPDEQVFIREGNSPTDDMELEAIVELARAAAVEHESSRLFSIESTALPVQR